MFLTTHVLLPVAAEILLAKKNVIKFTRPLVISTAVGALAPDIDLFIASPIIEHHQTLWHAPLLWLAVLVIGTGLVKLFKKPALLPIIVGFSVGTLSHVFLDTFGVAIGIAWLAPFSWREYSFTPLTAVTEQNWMKIYLSSSIFKFEMFLSLISIFWLAKERKFIKQSLSSSPH